MLKRFVHTVVRKRHFWRDVTFDELAEVYTSMTLRAFGFGIIGIFVPIYLYYSGVSLQDLFLFYGLFFILRVPVSFITGYTIGRIGPKHTIALSTLFTIIFLGMLLTYDYIGWPLLFLALLYTTANGLFFTAQAVDFSKIADSKHGGKELGWLYVFERLGGSLGPLVGGLVASLIAPEATLALAIAVLIVSLIPLFMTSEPVKVHQHVSFKKFPLRAHKRDFSAMSALSIQTNVNLVFWPLLVGVAVFTDNTYAKLGVVFAFSTMIAMFSAHMFGRFIDSRKGLYLLRYGVFMNVIMNFSRSMAGSLGGVLAISTLGEPVVLSYHMPLYKGFMDAGDKIENYRIVYFAWMEAITGLVKAIFCLSLFIASYSYDPVSVLRFAFIVAAFIGVGMLSQKFEALKK